MSASNPTLDASGNNVFPAVDMITLKPDLTISLTPILMGNETATDAITKLPATLNLTDPDSLSTDGEGSLVRVAQADSQHITITDPGGAAQPVTRLPVGDQLDDTVYPSGEGRLLVVDAGGSTFAIGFTKATGMVFVPNPTEE